MAPGRLGKQGTCWGTAHVRRSRRLHAAGGRLHVLAQMNNMTERKRVTLSA